MDHSHDERRGNEPRSLWRSRTGLAFLGLFAMGIPFITAIGIGAASFPRGSNGHGGREIHAELRRRIATLNVDTPAAQG